MSARLKLSLSEKDKKSLEKLANDLRSQSKVESIRKTIKISEVMQDESDTPMILHIDGEEFKNKAAVKMEAYDEASKDYMQWVWRLQDELSKLKSKAEKKNDSYLVKFWNALEIKPGFFGIRIDIKKLFEKP